MNFQPVLKEETWESVYIDKHEATPLQAWTGPEGARRLRIPDFMTIST